MVTQGGRDKDFSLLKLSPDVNSRAAAGKSRYPGGLSEDYVTEQFGPSVRQPLSDSATLLRPRYSGHSENSVLSSTVNMTDQREKFICFSTVLLCDNFKIRNTKGLLFKTNWF